MKYNISLFGRKGKELSYPKYAPHIILGTNISYLDVIAQNLGVEIEKMMGIFPNISKLK